jgi:hypothetical protein
MDQGHRGHHMSDVRKPPGSENLPTQGPLTPWEDEQRSDSSFTGEDG